MEVAEKTISVRLQLTPAVHQQLTEYQLKLSVKKKKRITQEQAIADLLSKFKV